MNEILNKWAPWLSKSQEAPEKPSAPVTVHIYDLGSAVAGINVLGRAVGTGAFHAGVEVYGKEYSFGCGNDGPHGTGIFYCPPRGCTAHVYREPIAMGETNMSKKQVGALIGELMREWPGSDYDLLRHNCCHFSDELCRRLGVGSMPPWVTSLAGVGAVLRSSARLAVGGAMAVPGLALNGMAAAADWWQAPPAAGDETNRGKVRAEPANFDKGDPFLCRMPNPDHRQAAAINKDANHADARGHFINQGANLQHGAQHNANELRDARAPVDEAFGELNVGDNIEVFSNSCQAWCAAQVKSIDPTRKMVTATFQLPSTAPDEIATKTLPLGHKDMRKVSAHVAQHKARNERGREGSEDQEVSNIANDLQPGDWIEVFSNSQKSWCLGRVIRKGKDNVSVVYQLPGAGPEDVAEERFPLSSKKIRNIGSSPSADRQPTQSWSAEEAAAYKKSFNMLMSFSTNSSGTVDADAVIQYLQGAGLPQKVFNEVWKVANRNNSAKLGFFEFAAACRLVGHCQSVLKAGEPIAAEVLVMAGDPLHSLLREGFLHIPPPMLPEFWGK